MSKEKRDALIADGKLNADGSRKRRCPTCGNEITEEQRADIGAGVAAAAPETIEADGGAGSPGNGEG